MRERLNYLEYAHNHNMGKKGENLVNDAINGGSLTLWTEQHDLVTADGVRLEIKFSKLHTPVKGAITMRWAWGHCLGSRNSKKYERLILIGEADLRYRTDYLDPTSPYTLFDVPFKKVKSFINSQGLINLSTNPHKVSGVSSKALFGHFAIQFSDLQDRYGIKRFKSDR